jgi:hypothetical protein
MATQMFDLASSIVYTSRDLTKSSPDDFVALPAMEV